MLIDTEPAAGAITVSVAAKLLPFAAVAVIVVVPSTRPVASPVAEMVAMVVSLDVQVNVVVGVASTPFASFAVA
ncbi:MAG TPA: hypothetical protein VGP25_15410, partial [Gemmatimonadaceae bacterium]|nr:hypothetical protein [Gemmatimonadaceae bacterium]